MLNLFDAIEDNSFMDQLSGDDSVIVEYNDEKDDGRYRRRDNNYDNRSSSPVFSHRQNDRSESRKSRGICFEFRGNIF